MSAINDGGPAFPTTPVSHGYAHDTLGMGTGCATGMTLRDWFAGQALVGVVANHKLLYMVDVNGGDEPTRTAASRYAYAIADAMIAAREKGAQ